jgi:hypothetical protein
MAKQSNNAHDAEFLSHNSIQHGLLIPLLIDMLEFSVVVPNYDDNPFLRYLVIES